MPRWAASTARWRVSLCVGLRTRCRSLAGVGQARAVRRVAIVGPGGAGKSTFARRLAERTGLPVIHLDHHFWQPGWVQTERDAWREKQAALLAGDDWIVDGNYGGTLDERLLRADTVIVIARRPSACVASAIWRTTKNHGKAVQAPGCPERYQLDFYRWIWNYPSDSRPRLDDAIRRHPHLTVVELTTRAETNRFLQEVAEADEHT